MQFLFNMLNHSAAGQRSLEDVIAIVGHQLNELGHHAVWWQSNQHFLTRDSGINIIVEGFTPELVRYMADWHSRGARFIILATEEPTPKGFNHGTSAEMIARQEIFPEAAKFCEGIWHLVPGKHVADWYGQFAPTAYMELGYASTLDRRDRTEPTHDFGFFGSLTKRRLNILKELKRRIRTPKAIKVVADFAGQAERDALMKDACVIVQLRKFEEMGLVSSCRCNTALCIGRPVVAEPHELSRPWDGIVSFSKTMDGFYDLALMVRSNWRGVHSKQYAEFRKLLTPQACVGEALKRINLDLNCSRAVA